MYDYLIVGSGLFGAVFAHEAAKAGKSCLVIDKRQHTGGNLHCQLIDNIWVHQYGAHIFHTSNRQVWQYVNQLTEFNNFVNSPLASYQGKLYHLPFNMNTFYELWGVRTPAEARAKIDEQRSEFAHITQPANLEEQALTLCGRDIYERLIKGYTEKQWGCAATQLPAFIIKRLPFRFTFDNNYFNDRYQGIPEGGGYNALINALLAKADVRLGTDYFAHRDELHAQARCTLYTGCIDEFYNYCHGHLDYRSLRFEHKRLNTPDFQGNAVVNYTERQVPYTRVIEHKHFAPGSQQPTTVVTYEHPDSFAPGKEPYYPVNDARNAAIYARYAAMADAEPDVLFGGRLARYTYADMDDTIMAALELCKKNFNNDPLEPPHPCAAPGLRATARLYALAATALCTGRRTTHTQRAQPTAPHQLPGHRLCSKVFPPPQPCQPLGVWTAAPVKGPACLPQRPSLSKGGRGHTPARGLS